MFKEGPFLLFSGTSHPVLAQEIADELGQPLGKVQIETFPDNEIGVQILENVRGRDVFVLQTIARHPNLYLMELLILVDALKRASARSICAVIPYFGYARQDRKDKGRVPITAKLVANLLERAGVSRLLTMDLHAEQIQGFFEIPVDNLYARSLLVQEVGGQEVKRAVVVAPDIGSVRMAQSFAAAWESDFAVVDKRRQSASSVSGYGLIGAVAGRDVLFVDDIYSTGATLRHAAAVCREAGAKSIWAVAVHAVGLGKAFEESAIEKMWVTNTIPLLEGSLPRGVKVVSVASLFGRAIRSIVDNQSISSLF